MYDEKTWHITTSAAMTDVYDCSRTGVGENTSPRLTQKLMAQATQVHMTAFRMTVTTVENATTADPRIDAD